MIYENEQNNYNYFLGSDYTALFNATHECFHETFRCRTSGYQSLCGGPGQLLNTDRHHWTGFCCSAACSKNLQSRISSFERLFGWCALYWVSQRSATHCSNAIKRYLDWRLFTRQIDVLRSDCATGLMIYQTNYWNWTKLSRKHNVILEECLEKS